VGGVVLRGRRDRPDVPVQPRLDQRPQAGHPQPPAAARAAGGRGGREKGGRHPRGRWPASRAGRLRLATPHLPPTP